MAGEADLGIPGLSDGTPFGHGGNASVFRARQESMDRDVAVKVLRGVDEASRRRFERERRAMGRLSEHRGILTIYDSGFTDRQEPYLILPFLRDGSLDDVLKEGGAMSWPQAVALVAEVADTLEFAHESGVLHRDLKPANILLDHDGSPLIADFGISRVVDTSVSVQSTALTLTPAYAPPEIIGGGEASVRTDVYSLAATLHALITGTAPFVVEGENVLSTLRRVAEEAPADLRAYGAPAGVDAVVQQAMAKDASVRPASAAALAAALRDVLAGDEDAGIPGLGAAPPPADTIVYEPPSDVDADPLPPADRGGEASTIVRPAMEPVPPAVPPPQTTSAPSRRARGMVVLALGGVVGLAAVFVVLSAGSDPDPDQTATEPSASATPPPETDVEDDLIDQATATEPPATPQPTTTPRPTTTTVPALPGGFRFVETVPVGSTNSFRDLVAGDRHVWSTGRADGLLSALDPETGQFVFERQLADITAPVAVIDGRVWVGTGRFDEPGTVLVLDEATGDEIARVPVGRNPASAVSAGGLVWIATRGEQSVSVIDPVSLSVVDTVATPLFPIDEPVVAEGLLWLPTAARDRTPTLLGIDPSNRSVVATIEVGPGAETPLFAGGLLWVANRNDGGSGNSTVSVVDPSGRSLVATVPVGPGPDRPAEVAGRIWVPNRNISEFDADGGTVSIIDPTSFAVVDTVVGPRGPVTPLAVGSTVFVSYEGCCSGGSAGLQVIDPADLSSSTLVSVVDGDANGFTMPVTLDGRVFVASSAGISILERDG